MAVRERLGIITAKYKSKKKEQLAASGISPEQTPLDEALEEIIERMDEAEKSYEQQSNAEKEKKDLDVAAAQEMREQACESSGETLKRKNLDTEKEAKKKSRSSGSDTMVYLKEKAEKEQELKLNELELRKQELEIRKKKSKIITIISSKCFQA